MPVKQSRAVPIYTASMLTSRKHYSLIALLMGWCLFFNAFACCLNHAQGVGAGSVAVAYCSVHERADLQVRLDDHQAEHISSLSTSLGCPLCASGSAVASLASSWRLPLFPIAQPFQVEYSAPVTAQPSFRFVLHPRAPPLIA